MIPLIILIATFVVVFAINKYVLSDRLSSSFVGRTALAAMMLTAGIAHFTAVRPMVAMMPDFIPAKTELVYLTGVLELLSVIGLLREKTAKLTGIALIGFYIAIFPANIDGALRSVDFGGMIDGPPYLFFRVPLQLLFIAWAWVFAVISVGKEIED